MKIKIAKYEKFVLSIMVAATFIACEHEIPINGPRQGIQPTFPSIQNEILSRKCAIPGCHTGSTVSVSGNLNMTAGQAYNNLVNVNSTLYGLPRIAPNDPDNSVLYQKVLGNNQFGNRMPLTGNQLSQEELDAIRDWILAGAPNN